MPVVRRVWGADEALNRRLGPVVTGDVEPLDLEIISPEDAEPVPPRRRRRRWPWLVLTGVALGAGAGYTVAARAAVRDLEQHWLAACDVSARAQAPVVDASRPGAMTLLAEEFQALQQRAITVQKRALADIRRRAQHVRTIDPGVRRLRQTVADSVRLPDVYRCALPGRRPVYPLAIETALRHELHRWHLRPASNVAQPVALPPITVTTLPVATEPTGTTLLVAGTSSQYVVDVDANTTRAVPGTTRASVSGRGWWVRFRNADAFLERLDASPIALAEGGAQYAAPAANNDAVWLVTMSDGSGVVTAQRFATHDGSPVGARVALPDETTTLLGEVPEGLLLLHQSTGELDVWDPGSTTTIRVVGNTEPPVSARGSLLAWAGCLGNRCGVHLTDTATGRDRFVTLENLPASLAVSPDGRTVAAAVHSPRRNLGDIVLVDVATTATRIVEASWLDRPDVAWGGAGDRVFIVSGLHRSIWMYRIDGRDIEEELHVRVPEMINALAVL